MAAGRGVLRLVALAACVVVPPAALAATGPPTVESVRVGFGESNRFKVGTWTPVRVQLRGSDERFAGTMELVVPDDDGTPTAVRQPVDVGPGQGGRVVLYARSGSSVPEFKIRFYDAAGRRRGPEFQGSAMAQIEAMAPGESLLLTLGNPRGVELVPKLPGLGDDTATNGRGLAVARIEPGDDQLPGRWYGYDAATAVVLDANDRDTLTLLNAGKGEALKQWVARGGHLVVAVGANWQQAREGVLGEMLPGEPTGRTRVTDLGALESFAGSTTPIIPGNGAVEAAQFTKVDAKGGKVLASTASVPLVIRGPYGFGRVTAVAIDVDQEPFASWADRGLFWSRALDLHRSASADATSGANAGTPIGGGQLYQSGVTDLATLLRRSLERFPGIRLVPFGWVAFLIFLYILLIGPGDYFFLKKVVKRMELTWITFPAIVAAVSLLAYFAAYRFKGTELRVNKVDALDIDQASGLARGWSWVDVFSPQNRDYDVAVAPTAIDRPGNSPLAGSETMLSWFGVPESGFGGMGGGNQIGFAGGGYTYMPTVASGKLAGLRIPIWSSRCLGARWFGPAPARVVEADLTPSGTDRLNGTLINRLDTPLEGAILAFGQQVYDLGTIAPGATVRVELAPDRALSGYLKKLKVNSAQNQNNSAGEIDRADLVRTLMFHERLGGGAAGRLGNRTLGDLDLSGQLDLDRPMLVARVARPASSLVLGGGSSEPKVDQTTVVRVILPLGRAPGDSTEGGN